MSAPWVRVPYDHKPSDTSPIYISTTEKLENAKWRPAYRDIVNGTSVVQIRSRDSVGKVWVRDNSGITRRNVLR